MRKVIAIDFDGCLFNSNFPDVGTPNWPVIRRAFEEKQNGAALILWTCRVGEDLEAAVQACEECGLRFDAVNENLPERLEAWGIDCRKVGADEYWDDLCVKMTPEACEAREKAADLAEAIRMRIDGRNYVVTGKKLAVEILNFLEAVQNGN